MDQTRLQNLTRTERRKLFLSILPMGFGLDKESLNRLLSTYNTGLVVSNEMGVDEFLELTKDESNFDNFSDAERLEIFGEMMSRSDFDKELIEDLLKRQGMKGLEVLEVGTKK